MPVGLSPNTAPSIKSDPAAISHQLSQLVNVLPGSAAHLSNDPQPISVQTRKTVRIPSESERN